MSSSPRLLVIEGNTKDSRNSLSSSGCHVSGEGYAATLRKLCPPARIHILRPTDGEDLPQGIGLGDFDGIALTGSALNVYDDTPPVRVQVELMRACFRSGTPIFGSCWGLQVAAVAAGGVVRANPRGREFGFARKITLNQLGVTHPMYRGKAPVFDAVAIHTDEVETLPPGSVLLASNRMSVVQAAEIRWEGGEFWGVQYHPEFDVAEIGLYGRRYAKPLTRQGFFRSPEAAEAWCVACLQTKATGRLDLRWSLGIDDDVLDDRIRLKELENWLVAKVLA